MVKKKEDDAFAWVEFASNNEANVYPFRQIEELAGKALKDAVVGEKVTVIITSGKGKHKEIKHWPGTVFKVSGKHDSFLHLT